MRRSSTSNSRWETQSMSNDSRLQSRFSSRRQLLIGAGASFLLLPSLRSLMIPSAAAQTSAPKRRFVVWISTNGINEEYLYPPNQNDLASIPGAYSAFYKPLANFGGPI